MKITQLKLPTCHHTDRELCYKKERSAWLLYDDTAMPRELIATISGSDLDAWQWQGECDTLRNFWQQETHFSTWRAALMDATTAYINHSK